jgi:hypothetical protein
MTSLSFKINSINLFAVKINNLAARYTTNRIMHIQKYKQPKALLAFISFLICCLPAAKAQSGQYLQLWGGPQFVSILNFDDFNESNLGYNRKQIPTYRAGGGVDYINNFNQNYGWQTGIYYSGQGQKYYGYALNFYSPRDSLGKKLDSVPHAYNSQVWMEYVRIPVMFRFNSLIDQDDRINLSIFLGFQAGYLLSARSYTNPDAPDSVLSRYPNFDYRKLYHAIDFGLCAGAQFNAKINDKLYGTLGIRFDRSLVNIENTSYVLPGNAPVEWLYPLSTKKETRITHSDVIVRMPSKNISVNVFIGIAFKIKQGKPENPHPGDQLPE